MFADFSTFLKSFSASKIRNFKVYSLKIPTNYFWIMWTFVGMGRFSDFLTFKSEILGAFLVETK